MIVRFGYVAMSNVVPNASPSKRMTATQFVKIADRTAALRKLERIAEENIHNSLRLLKHNRAHDIKLFRLSSKLVPLVGHECTEGWDCISPLTPSFKELGDYAKQHAMRLSFHPDHFTVLNSPREDVLESSLRDLEFHVSMFEAMGLDSQAKLVMHLGGSYGNKEKAMERFIERWELVPPKVKERLTLENDDKTYTARETLEVCERLELPMVLDIHHHQVNHKGEEIDDLWPRIVKTWEDTEIPPKIHVSSPKSEGDPRAHADFIDLDSFLRFLRLVRHMTHRLDVMIEAKAKDEALFKLMKDLRVVEGIQILDQASIEI
jgi:UV DNA damage endonuclease